MSAALDYWPSPPPWRWTADDLDNLPAEGPNGEPDFFKHVELIDGALDPATHAYALTGIHHDRLTVPVPFPITIDLGDLLR
ncbi:hypothetical protein ACSDR0_24205 [Streptosporangium sp. G11]|uniref:hypothetical protein n=1 Tax=Streptosporangium sp. G11 TaxID=3436926 RepID=UPI003EBD6FF4